MRFHLRHLVVIGLVVVAAAMMVEGARRVHVAEAMPAYSDPERAAQLRRLHPDEIYDDTKRAAFTRQWHADRASVTTDKWKVYDQGRALIVLSICLVAAIGIVRPWKEGAIAGLTTPSRRALILLGVVTYLSFVPALGMALIDEQEREELPWWADSIGLPLFGLAFAVLLTLPILLVVLWLALRRAELPVHLWTFKEAHPITSGMVTIVFGGLAAAILFTVAQEATSGSPYFIPSGLSLAYVLLCVRAALLAPRAAPAASMKHP